MCHPVRRTVTAGAQVGKGGGDRPFDETGDTVLRVEKSKQAVPRFGLGSPDSESGVITTTLHRRQGLHLRSTATFGWYIHHCIGRRAVRVPLMCLWRVVSAATALDMFGSRCMWPTTFTYAAMYAVVVCSNIVVSETGGFLSITDISTATHDTPSVDRNNDTRERCIITPSTVAADWSEGAQSRGQQAWPSLEAPAQHGMVCLATAKQSREAILDAPTIRTGWPSAPQM